MHKGERLISFYIPLPESKQVVGEVERKYVDLEGYEEEDVPQDNLKRDTE